jgi:hypothetical protein
LSCEFIVVWDEAWCCCAACGGRCAGGCRNGCSGACGGSAGPGGCGSGLGIEFGSGEFIKDIIEVGEVVFLWVGGFFGFVFLSRFGRVLVGRHGGQLLLRIRIRKWDDIEFDEKQVDTKDRFRNLACSLRCYLP